MSSITSVRDDQSTSYHSRQTALIREQKAKLDAIGSFSLGGTAAIISVVTLIALINCYKKGWCDKANVGRADCNGCPSEGRAIIIAISLIAALWFIGMCLTGCKEVGRIGEHRRN